MELGRRGVRALHNLFYPAQCLTCDELVGHHRALCPKCWSGTPFIYDGACDSCGRPLMGDARKGDLCEDCHRDRPPWKQGRATMVYESNARRIVLRLKHADRTDLAFVAGNWMENSVSDLVLPDHIVAPVPLHWLRIFLRRYNQAALLSARLAHILSIEHCPQLLRRPKLTRSLDRFNKAKREKILSGAIKLNSRWAERIKGRPVLLVDDVMTTGTTLRACTTVLLDAGAREVSVVVLARVASRD